MIRSPLSFFIIFIAISRQIPAKLSCASLSVPLARERFFCSLLGLADLLAQLQRKYRGNRQLVDAHLDKAAGQFHIRSQLTADTAPCAMVVSALDGSLNHAEHCLVMGIINIVQRLILTVDSQR